MPPQEKLSNAAEPHGATEKNPNLLVSRNPELFSVESEHSDCHEEGCLQCHNGFINQAFISENGKFL